MGIRVHKVIGYGFDDLTIKTGQFDICLDSRFNPDGYSCASYEDREKKWPMEEFQVQLKTMAANTNDWDSINYALLNQCIDRGDFIDFDYLMTWDTEGGLPNVCVFVPPGNSERWCQNDGQIDYYEETIRNNQEPHVLLINRTIYPYDVYVDLRDNPPSRVKDRLYRDAKFMPLNTDDQEMITKFRDVVVEDMGFDTWEELDKTIVPMVPSELIAALIYLKVFKDPMDAYHLKPMIYTYWG